MGQVTSRSDDLLRTTRVEQVPRGPSDPPCLPGLASFWGGQCGQGVGRFFFIYLIRSIVRGPGASHRKAQGWAATPASNRKHVFEASGSTLGGVCCSASVRVESPRHTPQLPTAGGARDDPGRAEAVAGARADEGALPADRRGAQPRHALVRGLRGPRLGLQRCSGVG